MVDYELAKLEKLMEKCLNEENENKEQFDDEPSIFEDIPFEDENSSEEEISTASEDVYLVCQRQMSLTHQISNFNPAREPKYTNMLKMGEGSNSETAGTVRQEAYFSRYLYAGAKPITGNAKKNKTSKVAGRFDATLREAVILVEEDAEHYVNFLENKLYEKFDNETILLRQRMWYQDDGAPAHFGRPVTAWFKSLTQRRVATSNSKADNFDDSIFDIRISSSQNIETNIILNNTSPVDNQIEQEMYIDNSVCNEEECTDNNSSANGEPLLKGRGIEVEDTLLKVELLDIARNYVKSNPVQHKVDEIVKKTNRDVLRLPPYHCQLNPTELIWAQERDSLLQETKLLNWQMFNNVSMKRELLEEMQLRFVVNTGSSGEDTQSDSF
ncbi:hypothetical protein CBL_08472 [Carabus blaptoides fortunei]